jgi:hypothetical protein
MKVHWVAHRAPVASCLGADGSARAIADKFAFCQRKPDGALVGRARAIGTDDGPVGRVRSMGTWHDAAVHAQLAAALGELSGALRSGFEWYQCRGAFFHNDAHYDGRLFGVWCVVGPPAELVFPRAGIRLAAAPGAVAVFDPFEVHGVLVPGRATYSPDDYVHAEPSIFVGFELDLTPAVAEAFGIKGVLGGDIISSQTRVCPASGQLSK